MFKCNLDFSGLLCLCLTSAQNDLSKNDILDELLEQAQAARDSQEFSYIDDDIDIDPDAASSSSLLDHLLNKAMKEKVSRESDSFRPTADSPDDDFGELDNFNENEDSQQQSRFKYLFFEILTPDEYNDIIYLGEDLLNPLEESVSQIEKDIIDADHDIEDLSQIGGNHHVPMSNKDQYQSKLSPLPYEKFKNPYESKLDLPEPSPSYPEEPLSPVQTEKIDDRKTKMESLLKRMTERYKVRSQEDTVDTKENIKTQKLKSMIDILEDKLQKYEKPKEKVISSRRIDTEPSYMEKLAERGVQRTRTTPSGYYQPKNKYTTTTPKPRKNQQEVKEKWDLAMDELADKISRKSSGIHRINLDEMLDLDMLEVPQDDQKSSDSYLGTTAVPPSDYYKPKRQIHPKLTFQRQDFGEVHRPSSKLVDLIREKQEQGYVSTESVIKSLPPISRYHNQEPAYKPTSYNSQNECPYIPKRPYSECYNAPPSECQNTGFPDPSCSPGALCCYDGCINLCWKNPNYPPKLPHFAPPPVEYSTPKPLYTPTPTPKVYGYTIEPQKTSTPGYVHADSYRSTPKPEYAHPTDHTLYPPPSASYKQPSISFIAKGDTGGASYSTMVPPHKEYYKEAKALDHGSFMQQYHPPSKSYLPPEHHKEKMQSYHPPSKEYLPPHPKHHSTPAPAHMTSYAPPVKSYAPPGPSSTIKPPSTSYLPPHSTIKPTYREVLTSSQKGYIPPAHLAHDTVHKGSPQPYMSTTYAPPTKEYLPPHPTTTAAPSYHSTPKPPHHLNVPSKEYLPPPSSHYEKKHMTHMAPPEKKYIPPDHMTHISPPEKQYLPPEHMSHMTPPEKSYIPPEHVSHMTPPEKNYLPPEHTSHAPEYMSHMSPPDKQYLPPDHMSHMSPPEKAYIPPKHMNSMHPPSHDYSPPDHMYKMHPPEKNYVPPHHMSHLVPPKESYVKPHHAVCPEFTLREKTECHKIHHQCWSPGVPDEDCPHHGLCCFDGCNNVCLHPSDYPAHGYHVPKHNAYLVPGHKYVPSPGHTDHTSFKHRTLHAPSKEYLPPTESMYHLVEGPAEYEEELPTSYLPPAKEYLPPKVSHHDSPQIVHKPSTHEKTKAIYQLPTKEYLPPPKPIHEDEKHPYASYLPPSKDYIPPPHDSPHHPSYESTDPEGKMFIKIQ